MMKLTSDKEIIKTLRDAEDYLRTLADKLGELGDKHELPHLIEEIIKLKKAGKVKEITTAWLQKKYKIGYVRATKLCDELKAKAL